MFVLSMHLSTRSLRAAFGNNLELEKVVLWLFITKTCPCNIQRIFSALKISLEKFG